MIFWAAATLGFSYYLSNFADYGVIYGSLGTAIALLVYLYLSAVALLSGEEVNAAIYRVVTESELESRKLRTERETRGTE